jgi:hypothetical protein
MRASIKNFTVAVLVALIPVFAAPVASQGINPEHDGSRGKAIASDVLKAFSDKLERLEAARRNAYQRGDHSDLRPYPRHLAKSKRDPNLASFPKGAFLNKYIKWFMSWPTKEILKFKYIPKSDLIMLHHGFGTAIRNKFLWDKSQDELRQVEEQLFAAGWIDEPFKTDGKFIWQIHPDDLSMAVIEMLHDHVQKIE